MLPFIPETMDNLKKRFRNAIRKPVNAMPGMVSEDSRPGNKREHVFDFEDGLRLIISRDYCHAKEVIHLSASVDTDVYTGKLDAELLTEMRVRFLNLSGIVIPPKCLFVMTKGGIPHWFIETAILN